MKTKDFDDYIFGRKNLNQFMNTFKTIEVEEPIEYAKDFTKKLDKRYCQNQDGLCEEDNCRCDYRAEFKHSFEQEK